MWQCNNGRGKRKEDKPRERDTNENKRGQLTKARRRISGAFPIPLCARVVAEFRLHIYARVCVCCFWAVFEMGWGVMGPLLCDSTQSATPTRMNNPSRFTLVRYFKRRYVAPWAWQTGCLNPEPNGTSHEQSQAHSPHCHLSRHGPRQRNARLTLNLNSHGRPHEPFLRFRRSASKTAIFSGRPVVLRRAQRHDIRS